MTMVCGLRMVFLRYFAARLTYVADLFNSLLALNCAKQSNSDPYQLLHIAQFSL